jgi:hypothetical protein
MSFLPFVLSFLLILVLGSSFLFTSFRSTSLEKTVILAQNRAKLGLLSKQAEADYKKCEIKKKTPDPSNQKETKEKKDKIPVYKDKRNKRCGLDSSKLNLWSLLKDSNPSSVTLYRSAVRLIQILYQDADFYKNSNNPKLAEKILEEMISKKAEDFTQLYPKDEKLSEIYYKMLKGTNTGYPPLAEYFKIEKSNDPPIRWTYATTPILRAVLGDAATHQVLAAEKASWEENHRTRVLPKETLRELLKKQTNTDFDINQLEVIFLFNKKGKGSPHTYVEKQHRVMANR